MARRRSRRRAQARSSGIRIGSIATDALTLVAVRRVPPILTRFGLGRYQDGFDKVLGGGARRALGKGKFGGGRMLQVGVAEMAAQGIEDVIRMARGGGILGNATAASAATRSITN